MPIAYGPVVSKKIDHSQDTSSQTSIQDDDEPVCVCSLCYEVVCPSEKMLCLSPGCLLVAHVICLAKTFLKGNAILPIEGHCPACDSHLLWGDLVRKKKGCYNNLTSTGIDSHGDCD
jgi:structure-specific endonuclease subunit SLX1